MTVYEFERTVIRVHNVGRKLFVFYRYLVHLLPMATFSMNNKSNLPSCSLLPVDRLPLIRSEWLEEEEDEGGGSASVHKTSEENQETQKEGGERSPDDVENGLETVMKGGIPMWLRCMYKHYYGVQIHVGGRATSIAHGLFAQEARDNNGKRVEDGKHHEYDFGAEVDLDGLPPYKHALAFKVYPLSYFSQTNEQAYISLLSALTCTLTNKHWMQWALVG